MILLGDDLGTAHIASRFGIRHIPNVQRNEYGTPLVNSLFAQAEAAAAYSVMGYANADIMLRTNILDAVERTREVKWPALLIGRRWDIDVAELWDFDTPDSDECLRRHLEKYGKPHDRHAMDYFIFPRGLWREIPPMAIGRTLWDNWLVWKAHASKIPIIDVSAVVSAIHQNHDYSHANGARRGAWHGPEAERNFALLGGFDRIFDLRDATWQLTPEGLFPIRTLPSVVRRFTHAAAVRPLVRPMQQFKRLMQGAS
ncbi:MAG: hypothetical protein HY737_08255 [Candidatus Omnitrophica bacterium]|nr:hypothetical protein [Candidatus Omnitrophota bacterium]